MGFFCTCLMFVYRDLVRLVDSVLCKLSCGLLVLDFSSDSHFDDNKYVSVRCLVEYLQCCFCH